MRRHHTRSCRSWQAVASRLSLSTTTAATRALCSAAQPGLTLRQGQASGSHPSVSRAKQVQGSGSTSSTFQANKAELLGVALRQSGPNKDKLLLAYSLYLYRKCHSHFD